MTISYVCICLLIIVLIIIVMSFKKSKCECNEINEQTFRFQQVVVYQQFLNIAQCTNVIKVAEAYGNMFGWTTDRHKHYPTTDILITPQFGDFYSFITNRIQTKLFPLFEKIFRIKKQYLRLHELFIVKYDGNKKNTQNSLQAHTDITAFSFVIALNDNFEGGGTYFLNINKQVQLNIGSIVLFSGKNLHEGITTKKGIRYILTGFVSYDICD